MSAWTWLTSWFRARPSPQPKGGTVTFKPKDLVWDTSTTTGTGDIHLAGVAPQINYRPPKDVYVVGDTFDYKYVSINRNEWEIGLGTYTALNTIARTTVYDSSNNGALVDFKSGTKNFWGDFPAQKIALLATINTDISRIYWFSATVNTDIGAALNAFMATVSDTNFGGGIRGGIVMLPLGRFFTTVQIVVPYAVRLCGQGKRTTSIIAQGGVFPINTAVVRLGRVSDGIVFDTAVQDLMVDCNLIAGSIGIYSDSLNEGCGCFRTLVKDAKDTGIFYDAGCEHFDNVDIEIGMSNAAANYGVKVLGSGWPSGGVPVSFRRVTIVGAGIGNMLACFLARNAAIYVDDMHMEGATDGLLIDGSNVSGVVEVIDGTGMTNTVHFNGGSSQLVILSLYATFSIVNLLLDDLTGTAINDVSYVPMWTRQQPYVALPPTVVTTSPYAVTELDQTIVANRSGASVGLSLPSAVDNTGRVLRIKATQPQLVESLGSDVVPLRGGAAQSSILPPVTGAWAVLQSNGANWVVVEQSELVSPVVSTAASSYVVTDTDTAISFTGTGCNVTLPSAASYPGRQLLMRTTTANPVNSLASNIGTLNGGVTSAILVATAGKWTILQSDGGSFWQVMAAN